MTKALFNEKSLPSIHQNCIVIFTAIQEVLLAFRWGFSSFNVMKAVSAAYCVWRGMLTNIFQKVCGIKHNSSIWDC